jgi:hypothetical protein
MSERLPTPVIPASPSRSGSPDHPPLLPWEDETAYRVLHEELAAEHRPVGPTERHLVEQLTVLFWRKRRVLEAERALHLAVLQGRLEGETSWSSGGGLVARALAGEEEDGRPDDLSALQAVRATPRADAGTLEELERDEAMTRQALTLLEGGSGAYGRALVALDPGTRAWWQDALENNAEGEDDHEDEEGKESWQPTSASLRRFLETEVATWYRRTRAQIARNPAIRRQAFGESLDPDRAAKLQAYDLRLDRQLERTLVLLLKLQELRGAGDGITAA